MDKAKKVKSKKAKTKTKPTIAAPRAKEESDNTADRREEEWGGISDTEVEPSDEKPALGKKTKKTKTKMDKKDKKDNTVFQVKDKKMQQQIAKSRAGNPFEALLGDRPDGSDDDGIA